MRPDFPKLMISTKGIIVLFESKEHGMVVGGKSKNWSTIGEYLTEWDMSQFSDYDGSVTIQNALEEQA